MKLRSICQSLDDLAPLSIVTAIRPPPQYRAYRVLSSVLSDLGIDAGNILTMRILAEGEPIDAFTIVAVRFEGKLLLRQYVPPRLLITNSIKALKIPVIFASDNQILAILPI